MPDTIEPIAVTLDEYEFFDLGGRSKLGTIKGTRETVLYVQINAAVPMPERVFVNGTEYIPTTPKAMC